MVVVHLVEPSLEFEAQFYLFLVILGVQHVFFFQFETQYLFLVTLLFVDIALVLLRLEVRLDDRFLFLESFDFFVVSTLDVFELKIMTICQLCDQNSVISLTAVLKEDLVHLPNGRDHRVVTRSSGQHPLQKLKKADRVDEESAIDTINILLFDSCTR